MRRTSLRGALAKKILRDGPVPKLLFVTSEMTDFVKEGGLGQPGSSSATSNLAGPAIQRVFQIVGRLIAVSV
jgi:hypothetical protein